MNRSDGAMKSGFAAALDVPSFNYGVRKHGRQISDLPQGFLLGSETASTVSSRGVYKFPVRENTRHWHVDGQCSSYEVEQPDGANCQTTTGNIRMTKHSSQTNLCGPVSTIWASRHHITSIGPHDPATSGYAIWRDCQRPLLALPKQMEHEGAHRPSAAPLDMAGT